MAVQTAEQLRDQAVHDDTSYRIVSSLTAKVGPRLAGSDNDQRTRLGHGQVQGAGFRQGHHRAGEDTWIRGIPARAPSTTAPA